MFFLSFIFFFAAALRSYQASHVIDLLLIKQKPSHITPGFIRFISQTVKKLFKGKVLTLAHN